MRLLVVEDEIKIAKSLEKGLKAEGYVIDLALESGTAEILFDANSYDLVLLDWMIPGGHDGPELIKIWRKQKKNTPILMITARTAIGDRVAGLDSGADDYLPKPFAFDELLARIRALLRRPVTDQQLVMEIGGVRLDSGAKAVFVDGKNAKMTAKEFRLIEYLFHSNGQVVSKDQLLNQLWADEDRVQRNTVETFVANIRRKLGKQGKIIETVRGYGYKVG